MKRKSVIMLLAMIFSLIMTGTVFAGTWRTGQAPNEDKWWYDIGNGTYAAGGWNWIDGNGDGIAECYYFDSAGWLYTSTVTPDGYAVNESGAWIENGAVKKTYLSSYDDRSYMDESDYNEDEEEYDEEILMPWYVEETIFNSDRSVLKYITLGCDQGCKIYYTIGVNPPDPTTEDERYTEKIKMGYTYGSPALKPGQTLKAIAVKNGRKSNVTTLRYDDARNVNRGKSGNIAGTASDYTDAGSNRSNSGNSSSSSTKATSRSCPVCVGRGTITCSYCHGSGIGQNASFGLGGDVYQGICPGCGGSGEKICAGCGGSGLIY